MIADDVHLGRDVELLHPELVNLRGCEIGDGSSIGAFVEIQPGVVIGRNVKIEPFSLLPSGVRVEDGVFIGAHVRFANDHYPGAGAGVSTVPSAYDRWTIAPTVVHERACIGAGSTILCGVSIGAGARIGAGSVVVHSIRDHGLARGNPARLAGTVRELNGGMVSLKLDEVDRYG